MFDIILVLILITVVAIGIMYAPPSDTWLDHS